MSETNPTTAPAAEPAGQVPAPAQWAILELMGHQRLAGRVSVQVLGGANLVRVDVPEVVLEREVWRNGQKVSELEVIPAHTRSLGAAAIYSVMWADEAAATLAAHSIRHQPIQPYALRDALEQMPLEQRQRVLGLAAASTLPQLASLAASVSHSDDGPDGDAHGF